MDEEGDYDGEVREIPFEEALLLLDDEAAGILRTAREQLYENYQKKGDGWQYEDARYHMWKGIDELFSATHRVKEGDLDRFEKRVADGLNHVLMASFVSYSDDSPEEVQRKADRGPQPDPSEVVEDADSPDKSTD